MHRTALLFGMICFILATVGSYFGAKRAVFLFQDKTEERLDKEVFVAGQEWVNIRSNGLRVHLTGLAPDEAARFSVLEAVGKVVDPARIRDQITILEKQDIEIPKFSMEILRNEEMVSLIGLVPSNTGRTKILESIQNISSDTEVTDMLEEANHPIPASWNQALEYGLNSLRELPRSKISIGQEEVIISAITESTEEKLFFEKKLTDAKPSNIDIQINLTSPRPVISPFSLRFSVEDGVSDLSSCSADTELTKARILRAALAAGAPVGTDCNIGLGVPTQDWAKAITLGINATKDLGGGTLTFTDSDVSLIADIETPQDVYDRVVGKLENELPDLFSLTAVLPPKPLIDGQTNEQIVPDFTATRSSEGLVQLRGRLPNEFTKQAVEIYAKSLFGNENVYMQTRLDENLPDGWPIRVLGGLEALAELHHGLLLVEPKLIEVKGSSGDKATEGEVSRILNVRVGTKQIFNINVEFDKVLAAKKEPTSPEECQTVLDAILTTSKIIFEPGKVSIDKDSDKVLDKIAVVLRKCKEIKFEIQGHTDSSGSEELNRSLSQRRADSVLNKLLSKRVLTTGITAKGYGPDQPIADNATEEGREQNRRIAFVVKGLEPEPIENAPSDTEEQTAPEEDQTDKKENEQ